MNEYPLSFQIEMLLLSKFFFKKKHSKCFEKNKFIDGREVL